MGSKKYPTDPINLLPVVGIPILNNSFIFFIFGFKSFLLHLNLGKRNRNIIILDNFYHYGGEKRNDKSRYGSCSSRQA